MVFIDKERIISYKLDIIESARKLEELISVNDDDFIKDEKAILAVRYLIIKVVEAMADIGKHLLAKIALKPVEEYGECFRELGKNKIIEENLSIKLIKLAGLRNLLIHRYWNIDDRKILHECRNGADNLYEFIKTVDTLLLKYK